MAGGKVDWDQAIDFLLRQSQSKGIFNPDRVRGRGAWLDRGQKVINIGDSLIVNGLQVPFDQYAGDFIYEQGETLARFDDAPLDDADGALVIDCISRLRWETPMHALMFAGWLVTAPICGALPWRAHCWFTAGAGGGKSWAINNIALPLLARTNVNVQSATTEAGIRQTLQSDALPVVFDEAEQNDRVARIRMQAVLELMRQASSENSAPIKKGSAGHVARSFHIRAQFLLISINVGLKEQADHTRVAVIALREPVSKDFPEEYKREQREFEALREIVESKITEEFGRRFVARSIANIETICANIDAFRRAASDILGSSRLGDTAGTLFAGAYSLTSANRVTTAEARVWLNYQGLRSETFMENIERDEVRCFEVLMRYELEVEGLDNRRLRRSVVELANIVHAGGVPEIAQDAAQAALLRRGFKVMDQHLWISNRHTGIQDILKEKEEPWVNNWGRILGRLPMRSRHPDTNKPIYFGPSDIHRAVAIPMSHILRKQDLERASSQQVRETLAFQDAET